VGAIANHPRRKHIANLIKPEFIGYTWQKSSDRLPNNAFIELYILHNKHYSTY